MPPDVAVSDLLLEWEERATTGRPITPEELCRTRPELLGELRRCIDLLRFVSPLFDLDGATADGVAFPTIPGFEILDRLGGGGMGVVYRARDTALERVVAIKMPHLGVLTGDVARSRFEREARVLAQMRHPNIVPVHAVSLAEGQPYFVMDYIPQGSLAGQASRLIGQVRAVAGLTEKVARAVHHAHERGILHRDLKPSNILLGERNQPLVADFGLAKTAGVGGWVGTAPAPGGADSAYAAPGPRRSVAQLTLPGSRPGTPLYMAPEQLRGDPEHVTARADVWALGVILFELLAGRHPFERPDKPGIVAAVCDEAPPSLRPLCRDADVWVESIILKCLEKDPARRYATAVALADDLARWRRGDPPSMVREGRVRRLLRRVQRRPALATAVGLLLAFGILALVYRPQPLTPAKVEERAEEEYCKATAPLVRDLATGRAVSLITETTRELPCRWRAGQGRVRFRDNPQEDGAVSVSALSPSLLELLRDTGTSAYRLVVELRHENALRGTPTAEVAVAFACRRYVTEEGSQWFFARVKFADVGPRADVYTDKAGQPAGVFQLGFFHLGDSHSGNQWVRPANGPDVHYRARQPPAPPGLWRRIEIEVRPGEFRAKHWDGKAVTLVPAVAWPRALAVFQLSRADLAGIDPHLMTRGPVGLYLDSSVVSLRRFVVEPLGEEE
jgi:serine/threonine protein kinase